VPVWTPDQLVLALSYTAYCLLAPILKDRRFAIRYGDRFQKYRARVPYFLPRLPPRKVTTRSDKGLPKLLFRRNFETNSR
jgi:hypothetical protein